MMVRLCKGFRYWKAGTVECPPDQCVSRLRGDGTAQGTWCEVLREDTPVRPYFDFDKYQSSEDVEPTLLPALIADVGDAVGVAETDIAVASRCRWVVKDDVRTYKVSYRFYVQGVRTTPKDMRALLDGRSKNVKMAWDKSVYRKEGLLGCVFNCKPGDAVPLTPVTEHPPEAFVVQLVRAEDSEMVVRRRAAVETPESAYASAPAKRLKLDVMMSECEDAAGHLSHAEMEDARDAIVSAWKSAHPEFGDLGAVDKLTPTGDVFFVRWGCKYCMNKSGEHERNHSYLVVSPLGVRQRCFSSGCDEFASEWVELPASVTSVLFAFPDDPVVQTIVNNLSKSHVDIAKIVAMLAGSRWVYSGETWWEFSGHKWNRGEVKHACPSLSMLIAHTVKNKYAKAAVFFKGRIAELSDQGDELAAKRMEAKAKIATKISEELGNSPTIANVLKRLEDIMIRSVEDFVERLDSDPFLVCFQNGVVDLRTKTIRDGTPEDMISLMTTCEYDEEADTGDIDRLIRSCMKDEDTFKYVRQMMGKFLVGSNVKEEVFFFVGNGRNGKGVLAEFMKAVMGDYYETTPGSYYLYQDKESGAANPNIAGWKGKRMLMTAETPQDAKFQSDKLKTISGNDVLKARFLHMSHYVTFTPMFKPVLQTNHLPDFTDVDTGLLERIVVIHFPYTFVERANLDPSDPHLKVRDESLKSMRDVFKTGLAKLMVDEAYDFVAGREVAKSEYVVAHTKSYKKDINTVDEFIANMVEEGEIVKEADAKIIVRKLLDTFKTECNNDAYTQSKFTRELKKSRFKFVVDTRRVGTGYREKCIVGWKLAHQDEDFARV